MGQIKVGIIGCGIMGASIAEGLLAKRICVPEKIFLSDKDALKQRGLSKRTGAVGVDLESLIKGSDYIIIAVKPQDSSDLFPEIARHITGKTMVITIMAGVRIATVNRYIGKKTPVARAMPNLAAKKGASVTAIAFNIHVTKKEEAIGIFKAIGDVVPLDEKYFDAFTAVAGSGPAYLFFMAASMVEAAVKMGLSRDIALKIVRQTVRGAALLMDDGIIPAELVKQVASKGGTTEAALRIFDKQGLKKIVINAVDKAKCRSVELSR
ncbi:MAG: pyrroline-5-carboxylate reductase [Candidatus Omnitrophica bacterium]|nr:pyrroline-5-carboxylate reductase [Candidatus Omnitrophota bacterium]